MSNDLLFQKVKSGTHHAFPCDWDKLEAETTGFPCEALADILADMGAVCDPGGRYELDLDDDGRLYVDLNEDSAFVDMHVSPRIIIRIFDALVARDAAVVLFEMGTGQFHNPESYRKFVQENYEDGA